MTRKTSLKVERNTPISSFTVIDALHVGARDSQRKCISHNDKTLSRLLDTFSFEGEDGVEVKGLVGVLSVRFLGLNSHKELGFSTFSS